MRDLIGKQCRCIFNLPANEWPFNGWPAWVRVLAVDMPMVKLESAQYSDRPKWVNCAIIKEIECSEARPKRVLLRWLDGRL